MDNQNVAERVIKVFAEFKKVPPEEISMDSTFEELGFDSLDGLNLIFELEEEFDLTVPDDKVQSMKSVREAVEGIEMLMEAKAQGIDVNAVAAQEFAKKQAEFRALKEEKAKAKETAAKEKTKETTASKPKKTASSKETSGTPKTKKAAGKKKSGEKSSAQ